MAPPVAYTRFDQEAKNHLHPRAVHGGEYEWNHRLQSLPFLSLKHRIGLSTAHQSLSSVVPWPLRRLTYALGLNASSNHNIQKSTGDDVRNDSLNLSLGEIPASHSLRIACDSVKESVHLDWSWATSEKLGMQVVLFAPRNIRKGAVIVNTHYEHGRLTTQTSVCTQQQSIITNLSVRANPSLTVGGELGYSFAEKLAGVSVGIRLQSPENGDSRGQSPQKVFTLSAGAFGNIAASYFQRLTQDEKLSFSCHYHMHLYSFESGLALGLKWKPSSRWTLWWTTDSDKGFASGVSVSLPKSVSGIDLPFSSLRFYASTHPTGNKNASYGIQLSNC